MRTYLLIILLFLITKPSKAQLDESIVREILYDLFQTTQDTIFLESKAYKTYFDYDSISFVEETRLKVPKKIIREWKENVMPEKCIYNWNQQLLNTLDTVYIDIETELSKSSFISLVSKFEVENLLKKRGSDIRSIRLARFYSILRGKMRFFIF